MTGKDRLKQDEGLSLQAYKDTLGFWTIGFGHLLGSTQRMSEITRDEAEVLFEMDYSIATNVARRLFPLLFSNTPTWDVIREDVVINMAFNLGFKLAGFKKFIAAVERSDWQAAKTEMLDSQWATQVKDRATRLAEQMEKGTPA